jgi:ubiquinone/menaquinone biosynthesis C-methylase UbiE
MVGPSTDAVFAGSVPELYDRYLVPLIFQTYADDIVERLNAIGSRSVLEVAAGTGVVTRAMAAGLAPTVAITCSDLNQPMLDHAASVGVARPVTFRQADVEDLPFEEDSFDAVVCQFGIMFFPNRLTALLEIRRVLAPGGSLIFNTWDRLETNEFAYTVTLALTAMFPHNPPKFLDRTPHGHYDELSFRDSLSTAGFSSVSWEVLEARSVAATCLDPAIAYCQGTPLRDEIENLDPTGLVNATNVAARAIAERFGETNVDGLIRGFVATAST